MPDPGIIIISLLSSDFGRVQDSLQGYIDRIFIISKTNFVQTLPLSIYQSISLFNENIHPKYNVTTIHRFEKWVKKKG